jgi:hypothetical protein
MGLDAYVPETDVHYSLGNYGWYHSFRTAVCEKLENGKWGSRYPLLMNHSDCDGEYSPEESALLKEEVKEIRERFKNLTYPVGIYRNREGKTLGIAPKYSEDGFFVFCTNGFDFGVHDLGIVVGVRFFPSLNESTRQLLAEFVTLYRSVFQEITPEAPIENGERLFVAYFDRLELAEDGSKKLWRGTGSNGSIDFPPDFDPHCPPGTVLIEKDTIPALEFFDVPLDRLEKLAEASIEAGQPIIFC